MTQIDHATQRRKKILIVDVPGICKTFASFVHRWGYEVIVTYHTDIDAILEMTSREKIDLLIVAKELTLKGPSLSEDWKNGDEMEVDNDFGIGVLSQLRLRNSNLPVILLTTDSLEENKWIRDSDGKLDWVMTEKVSRNVDNPYDDLKNATEEFLGRGLAIREWVRVLIIDDEVETCLNLKGMLRSEGYRVDHATTIEEAFQKLERDLYDLLLVDIELEGWLSGIDVIKRFREKEKRPKIIVLSATPRDEIKSYLQKEGIADLVDRYLDKSSYSIPGRLMNRVTGIMEQYSE